MIDSRQGNDLKVIWSIMRDGKPFSIAGKKLKLYLKSMYVRKEVTDFSVQDNQIHWTFYGKDQKSACKYSLILVVNEDEVGMITTDTCDFVCLVPCSCMVRNGDDAPNVETETIHLTSEIDYASNDYDDTALWDEVERLEKDKADKADIPTKVSDLEIDVELGGSYDDSELREAIAELEKDKQDSISDLEEIRSGAAKGATALQSIPSEYVTETELEGKGYATAFALNDKVDKIPGKGLSTEDFTSILKAKLEGLNNYNDEEIQNALSSLQTQFNTLVSGNASDAINSFNEIIAFLDGIQDTQDLSSIIASIEQQIAGKMDNVTLATVATSGSYNDLQDKPTIPDISGKQDTLVSGENIKTINGKSILGEGDIVIEGGSGGTTDLTGYATEDYVNNKVSTKVDKVEGKGLSANDYTDEDKQKLDGVAEGAEVNVQSDWDVTDESSDAFIKNKPEIPAAVTEDTVSGWGFTKNEGTYSKPSDGIPASDLDSDVQAKLDKVDRLNVTAKEIGVEVEDVILDYATESYVDSAIAAAITTILNTEV